MKMENENFCNSNCINYNTCEIRKLNSSCPYEFLGSWVYNWDGSSGNM